MTLRLITYNETPPDGWRYKDPETGVWIRGPTWKQLLKEVRKHRQANNLPIPLGLNDAIEQQLCEIIPPECCKGEGQRVSAPARPLTLPEAMEGTKTILDWWLSGRRLAEAGEAERRAIICMRCHFNQPVKDCASCSLDKLRQLSVALVSQFAVPHDHALYVCSICGCALQAKVRMPLDLLQKRLSDHQNQRLPEWCWLKKRESDPATNHPA